jgi:hypothetical protein
MTLIWEVPREWTQRIVNTGSDLLKRATGCCTDAENGAREAIWLYLIERTCGEPTGVREKLREQSLSGRLKWWADMETSDSSLQRVGGKKGHQRMSSAPIYIIYFKGEI